MNCTACVLTFLFIKLLEVPAMLNDNNVDIPLLVSHFVILLKDYFVDLNLLMYSSWKLKDPAFRLLSKNPPFPLCLFFL